MSASPRRNVTACEAGVSFRTPSDDAKEAPRAPGGSVHLARDTVEGSLLGHLSREHKRHYKEGAEKSV